MNLLALLGERTLAVLRGWGRAALFFFDLLLALPAALRRFGLVVTQIHAIGNRSLIIILASGMAVMPTTSAPKLRYRWLSARVENCGPSIAM